MKANRLRIRTYLGLIALSVSVSTALVAPLDERQVYVLESYLGLPTAAIGTLDNNDAAIVLIDFDATSVERLGGWPVGRDVFQEVVSLALQHGAIAVGVPILVDGLCEQGVLTSASHERVALGAPGAGDTNPCCSIEHCDGAAIGYLDQEYDPLGRVLGFRAAIATESGRRNSFALAIADIVNDTDAEVLEDQFVGLPRASHSVVDRLSAIEFIEGDRAAVSGRIVMLDATFVVLANRQTLWSDASTGSLFSQEVRALLDGSGLTFRPLPSLICLALVGWLISVMSAHNARVKLLFAAVVGSLSVPFGLAAIGVHVSFALCLVMVAVALVIGQLVGRREQITAST